MNLNAMAYKSEVLPTTVRTNGTAFGQVAAKLASALGSLIKCLHNLDQVVLGLFINTNIF